MLRCVSPNFEIRWQQGQPPAYPLGLLGQFVLGPRKPASNPRQQLRFQFQEHAWIEFKSDAKTFGVFDGDCALAFQNSSRH
jgi:hypothetical protein